MTEINRVITDIEKAGSGKHDVIEKVLKAMLAGGHVLLEDVPGVGKTTMALAFSRAMGLRFRRIQFTPDVVPSDVTGYVMFDRERNKFVYRPGAAVCNLLLADEINRTSSKTQSALLEVMQEGKITVDGVVRPVPAPFTVIATQNPIGTAGTQKLPEAQLDRFMVRLSMGYPDRDAEIEMMKSREGRDPLADVQTVLNGEELLALRKKTDAVYTDDKIYEYIADLTKATRDSGLFRLGLSPRASLALARMARSHAFVRGRDYVLPEDVREVFADVSAHRVVISSKAQLDGKTAADILPEILKNVPEPRVSGVGE